MTDSHGSDQNKALLKKIIDIFNTGDLSEVDLIFSADYFDHQRPAGIAVKGPNEFRQLVMSTRESLSNLKVTIEDLIAETDKVVGRLHWHLTDRAGRTIHRETIDILHLINGKVVEHWGAEVWRTET